MTPDILVETVWRVLAIQRAAGADLALTGEILKECPPAAAALASIKTDLGGLTADLEGGLLRLGAWTEKTPESRPGGSAGQPPSSLLGLLYGRLSEAGLACAALHAVAHRAFDSSGDGNFADMAEAQSLAYLTAAAAISEVISDVAVWEMEEAQVECQCRCSSCGIGICLCARHGRDTVAKVRQAAAVRPGQQGIAVREPRTGSPAARAGLRPGDVIIGAVDRPVAGPLDLQTAIRDAPADADVALTIARDGAATGEVILKRV